MTKRVLWATLVGGMVVFIAGSFLHTVSGLAEVGVKAVAQEDVMLSAMRGAIPEPGFYVFPAPNRTPHRG
jgi:hypothetical protein